MNPLLYRIVTGKMRVLVECEREVAYDSLDHLHPWGTLRDNSRNKRFNRKVYSLYGGPGRNANILDLGCSGGGFVKDCLDDEYFAIGLEGSDFSKRAGRAEWATIPEFLFTCDISKEFVIMLVDDAGRRERISFDIVTSWDVLEHIDEDGLSTVARNVLSHLAPSGLWIMSIPPYDDIVDGVNLHKTVRNKAWWTDKFETLGLLHKEEYVRYFNTQFIRGPKYSAPFSFHLCLARKDGCPPAIPPERFTARIMDRWIGSRAQLLLKSFVTGDA